MFRCKHIIWLLNSGSRFHPGHCQSQLGGWQGGEVLIVPSCQCCQESLQGFCSTLISYQLGLGMRSRVFFCFFFFFLNSKNTAFKSAQHQARMTRFFRRAHHSFEQLKWWGLQEGIGGERQPWWLSLGAAGCSACCFCIFLWYSSIGRLFLTSSPGKTSPSFLSAQRRLWAPVRLLNLGAYRMMMENISHIK